MKFLALVVLFSVNLMATTLTGVLTVNGVVANGKLTLQGPTGIALSRSCGGNGTSSFSVPRLTTIVTNGVPANAIGILGNDCFIPVQSVYRATFTDAVTGAVTADNWYISGATMATPSLPVNLSSLIPVTSDPTNTLCISNISLVYSGQLFTCINSHWQSGTATVTCSGTGIVQTSTSFPHIVACANYDGMIATHDFDLLASPDTGDYTLYDSVVFPAVSVGTLIGYGITWYDEQGIEDTYGETGLIFNAEGDVVVKSGQLTALSPVALNNASQNGFIQPGNSPVQIHAVAGHPIHVHVNLTPSAVGTVAITSGGSGWNIGDSGTIIAGNQDSNFIVNGVTAPGGAVTSITWTVPGARGTFYRLQTGATGSGAGTNITLNILTLWPVDLSNYNAVLIRNK